MSNSFVTTHAYKNWCRRQRRQRESTLRKAWPIGSMKLLMFMAPNIWGGIECVGTKLLTPKRKVIGNHNSNDHYPKTKPYNRHDAKAEAEVLQENSDLHGEEEVSSQGWAEGRRVACKKVRIRPRRSCKVFRDMHDRVEVVCINSDGSEVLLETIWKVPYRTVYR